MPALAVIEPVATTDPLRVIVDELVMPLTVKTPALAVIEPKCAVVTYKVGEVIDPALVMPLTVKTPALAVIEPKCAVVTYNVGEVIAAEL